MKLLWVAAISLLTLSACSHQPAVKPIVTVPIAKPIRPKPLAAMVRPPRFPSPPANLDQLDDKEQARRMGELWIEAAEAYSVVKDRNETLIDFINLETCHGE